MEGDYDLGTYLRKLAKNKGYTQAGLGDEIGRSATQVGNNMREHLLFKLEAYIKLANVLDVSIDSLIYGGKKRVTKLGTFAKIPISKINVDKLPEQPDSLGKYLLDYVIETDNLEKFLYFLKKDVFLLPLHNHIGLISFLIRHNQHKLLREGMLFTEIDPITKICLGGHRSFEFPILDFCKDPAYQ